MMTIGGGEAADQMVRMLSSRPTGGRWGPSRSSWGVARSCPGGLSWGPSWARWGG